MEKLPNELIQDILQRGNLEEIEGLCESNSFFKEHCSYIIEKKFGKILDCNYYDLYKAQNTYYICITTNEGQTRFTKALGINKVATAFRNLISKFDQRMQTDTNISWSIDNQENTHMLSMNFHYYSDVDCVMNFDVIIQGHLKNYTTCDRLQEEIVNQFETL
jgi:hypothetical protein